MALLVVPTMLHAAGLPGTAAGRPHGNGWPMWTPIVTTSKLTNPHMARGFDYTNTVFLSLWDAAMERASVMDDGFYRGTKPVTNVYARFYNWGTTNYVEVWRTNRQMFTSWAGNEPYINDVSDKGPDGKSIAMPLIHASGSYGAWVKAYIPYMLEINRYVQYWETNSIGDYSWYLCKKDASGNHPYELPYITTPVVLDFEGVAYVTNTTDDNFGVRTRATSYAMTRVPSQETSTVLGWMSYTGGTSAGWSFVANDTVRGFIWPRVKPVVRYVKNGYACGTNGYVANQVTIQGNYGSEDFPTYGTETVSCATTNNTTCSRQWFQVSGMSASVVPACTGDTYQVAVTGKFGYFGPANGYEWDLQPYQEVFREHYKALNDCFRTAKVSLSIDHQCRLATGESTNSMAEAYTIAVNDYYANPFKNTCGSGAYYNYTKRTTSGPTNYYILLRNRIRPAEVTVPTNFACSIDVYYQGFAAPSPTGTFENYDDLRDPYGNQVCDGHSTCSTNNPCCVVLWEHLDEEWPTDGKRLGAECTWFEPGADVPDYNPAVGTNGIIHSGKVYVILHWDGPHGFPHVTTSNRFDRLQRGERFTRK